MQSLLNESEREPVDEMDEDECSCSYCRIENEN